MRCFPETIESITSVHDVGCGISSAFLSSRVCTVDVDGDRSFCLLGGRFGGIGMSECVWTTDVSDVVSLPFLSDNAGGVGIFNIPCASCFNETFALYNILFENGLCDTSLVSHVGGVGGGTPGRLDVGTPGGATFGRLCAGRGFPCS